MAANAIHPYDWDQDVYHPTEEGMTQLEYCPLARVILWIEVLEEYDAVQAISDTLDNLK